MAGENRQSGGASLVWHYTVVERLNVILADGVLRPVAMGALKGVKPVVWFTSNQDWEPTANRLWQSPTGSWTRLGKDQTIVLFGGLARIGVAPATAPLDWKGYKEHSGIPPKAANTIYNEAVSVGARPGQWSATFDSVPREKWLAVEVWQDEQWVPRAF
jgi:hypothetical protein